MSTTDTETTPKSVTDMNNPTSLVWMVNVNGSIVQRIAVDNQNNEQTIAISELSTGIYFMSIQMDSIIQNIKPIVK